MTSRRWFAVASPLFLSFFLGVTMAHAQDRDHDQDRDHHDRDRARDHHEHDRFDDHDRNASRDWYRDHHEYFRTDEGRYWRREWEPDIREGFVFTRDMRRAVRPVPPELLVRLEPVPRGYRYVVIGPHVCLVDNRWRVNDVLHFELNF